MFSLNCFCQVDSSWPSPWSTWVFQLLPKKRGSFLMLFLYPDFVMILSIRFWVGPYKASSPSVPCVNRNLWSMGSGRFFLKYRTMASGMGLFFISKIPGQCVEKQAAVPKTPGYSQMLYIEIKPPIEEPPMIVCTGSV